MTLTRRWSTGILSVFILNTVLSLTTTNSKTTFSSARSSILESKMPFVSLKGHTFNEFDWDLSKAVGRTERDSNLVLSPCSVKLVIAMLYEGAVGNTATEIETALRLTVNSKSTLSAWFRDVLKSLQATQKEYELDVGTKLFIDKTAEIKPAYIRQLIDYYNSSIERVDFKQETKAAIDAINNWAYQVTHGKIQQLASDADAEESTVMLLLNAIYFKGYWEKPFAIADTKPGTFYLKTGSNVEAPIMNIIEKFYYRNISSLDSQIIRLNYLGNKFAMYVLLPNSKTGIGRLIDKINPLVLSKALNEMTEETIKLSMPKFNFESTLILGPILQELGIKDMFNSQRANLSNVGQCSSGNLAVSNVLQKAGLEVNEKGSTVYAASEAGLTSRFGDSPAITVDVNRPFVFIIADESTGTIIAVGKVENPLFHGQPVVTIPAAANETEAEAPTLPIETRFPVTDTVDDERYNYFDTELLQKIHLTSSENIVVSPVSVKSALALLLEGARGKTEHEIKTALRLPEDRITTSNILKKNYLSLKDNSASIELQSENRVFLGKDEKLSEMYKNAIKEQYSTELRQVNFNNGEVTSKIINEWINNVTNGLIPSVVKKDDFDAATRLLLVNAIYFKGAWMNEFDKKSTRVDCFYSIDNKCQKSYLMYRNKEYPYIYDKSLSSQITELPFKDERYGMLVLLPTKRDGVKNLIKDLQHKSILDITKQMKLVELDMILPRFTIEYSTSLSRILPLLDIKDVFSKTANLSGILDSKEPIAVKDILHKAKIEVNEYGAKAAAVSAVMVVTLMASRSVPFTANHPFVFIILDKQTGASLFEGVVSLPDTIKEGDTSTTTVPIQSPSKIQARAPLVQQPSVSEYQEPQPTDKEGVKFRVQYQKG